MAFSPKATRAMQPGDVMTFPDFPGLRMTATASRRSWIYRYRSPVDNAVRQVKLGVWPAMSHGEAVAAWEGARTARDSGVDAAMSKRQKASQEPVTKPGEYTVRELFRDFIVEYAENSRKSTKNVRLIFKALPESFLSMLPQEVTRKHAYDLIQSRLSAPTMAALLRSELGAAWAHALDASRIPPDTPNWWREVMRGKIQSAGRSLAGERVVTKRVLSDAEAGTLLRWIPKANPAYVDVLILYLWTATRGSEIVSMDGREITREPDGVWWTVPKEKTKNADAPHATDLRVPLIGLALEVVERRLAEYGTSPLFPGLVQRHVTRWVYDLNPYARDYVETGLTVHRWTPHDLRRTARTMLAALGCPHEVAEAIQGHMLPGVAGRYNLHRYNAERRVWLTRLSEHLEHCALIGV